MAGNQCCLELQQFGLGEGAGAEHGEDAELDGRLDWPTHLCVTNEGDELRCSSIHQQAAYRLSADRLIGTGLQQAFPKGEIVRRRGRWRWRGERRVAFGFPCQEVRIVTVTWIIGDEGVVAEADDAGAGG